LACQGITSDTGRAAIVPAVEPAATYCLLTVSPYRVLNQRFGQGVLGGTAEDRQSTRTSNGRNPPIQRIGRTLTFASIREMTERVRTLAALFACC